MQKDKDGKTRLKNLIAQQNAERIYRKDDSYTLPPLRDLELPDAVAYIWNWFFELVGEHCLTWQEVYAWARLKGIEPTQYELDILFRLDNLYWKVTFETRNAALEAAAKKRG